MRFTGSVELAYAEDSPIKLCNAMKQSNIAFREHARYVHATVLQRFQDVEGVARPRQCRSPDSELMQQNRSGSNPTLLSTPQIASGLVIGPRREPRTVPSWQEEDHHHFGGLAMLFQYWESGVRIRGCKTAPSGRARI